MIDMDKINFWKKQKTLFSSVIISAGKSSRMGRHKALLPIGRYTVLSRIVNNLSEYSESITIVVNEQNYEAIKSGLIASEIEWYGVQLVINKNAEKGMFSSVKEGLKHVVANKPTILHLIDQPFISDETYESLVENLDDEHLIFQPSIRIDGRFRAGHPLIFQPEFRDYLLSLPDETNLKEAMRNYRGKIKYVEVEDEAIIHNLNTLEDFSEKLNRYEGKYGNTSF